MVLVGNHYNDHSLKYKTYIIKYQVRNAISDPTNIRLFYDGVELTNTFETIEEAMRFVDILT